MTDQLRQVGQRSAERLVRSFAASEPETVALAEVVALAVTVDPALLRAARRELFPHRGPDLEADLWHSPLVRGSNHAGIVFDETVTGRLLLRLGRYQDRREQARRIVAAAHGGLDDRSPGRMADTVRLEEELRYLALEPDGHRRARALLHDVVSTVEESGAEGLHAWLDGLFSRLPLPLHEAMSSPGSGRRSAGGGLALPEGLEAAGARTIGVRLLEAAVEIRAAPQGSMHELRVPGGAVPAVFVDRRLVSLESLPHIEPLEHPRSATIQALDGAGVVLRRRRRELTPRRPSVLRGLSSEAWGCAFSPDGTVLATTGEGTVLLWDAMTGAPLRTLTGHRSRVRACAFSPDGTLLASVGLDRTVRLWDTSDGAARGTLTGHVSPVECCAFSPDGALLVTSSRDATARIWDPITGDLLHTLTGHNGEVWACAVSPDGALLATTGSDRTVRLWRSGTRTLVHTLRGHSDSVESCAFSPDGSVLATTSVDRTVRLWDPVTGALRRTLTGHTNSVWACAFSPDGTLLASTSNDGTVRIWDPTTGGAVRTFTGHGSGVHSCAFAPGGAVLATASRDRTVRLWDVTVARPLQRIQGHTSWIQSCAYAPDGTVLATAGADRVVRLWDPPTGTLLRTLTGHANSVEDCAYAADGQLLATAGADHSLRVWEPASGRLVSELRGHTARVHACAFSPTTDLLASAGADGTVGLWDPEADKALGFLVGHRGEVRDCAFSPDGSRLASAGADQTVRLWDVASGSLLRSLTGHIREVLACAFSADGRWLASVSHDQTVRLWDPETGAPHGTLRGHTSRVHACAFSPDGSLLATASADGTVRLWDPAAGEAVDRLEGDGSVLACAFSPDGTALAATGADRAVTVWNLLTRAVAAKGDTVALWLGGSAGDAAAIAGAVAARPRTAVCTPVIAAAGGALPGVLLAAGLEPRSVEARVVATSLSERVALPALPGFDRWRDPERRLARQLASLGVASCGDLRVPVDDDLHRYRFHAVLVDMASGELVVLPRDARRFRLDPDAIPLAALVVAAAGLSDVTIGDRRFTSARGRAFDPGPWYEQPPIDGPVLAVDVEDRRGAVPARSFPGTRPLTTVTIPWLYLPEGTTSSRRHRAVLARIGAQSLRGAVTDDPNPPTRPGPGEH
jgi:WD40 repeat protein